MKPPWLRQGIKDYLTLRRQLGFVLQSHGRLLLQFATYMERRRERHITSDLAVRWAQHPGGRSQNWCSRRLAIVRQFARYWSAFDPRCEVPPAKLLPRKRDRHEPRICTDDQLASLLRAAKDSSLGAELLARSYHTVFALLAVTGMRRSEVVTISRDDVDLVEGILTIRQTKFRKTRLVPVHETTRCALAAYARFRDRVYPQAKTNRFFVSDRGGGIARSTVDQAFVDLSKTIGMRGASVRLAPRLHDLRHRFAVRTVIGWYRSGEDVEQRMPALSTYLGHACVRDTYWYLSACPELMQEAARRLDRRWEACS